MDHKPVRVGSTHNKHAGTFSCGFAGVAVRFVRKHVPLDGTSNCAALVKKETSRLGDFIFLFQAGIKRLCVSTATKKNKAVA